MWRVAVVLSMVAAGAACGSSIRTGVVPTPGIETFEARGKRHDAKCDWSTPVAFLERPPQRAHVVVGTVEVRTTRPRTAEALKEALIGAARSLDADALVPPAVASNGLSNAEHNPLRPFYAFDDGRTKVVEAQGIMYTDGCP
ncbi:MAG: hypothetical protein RL385_5238 [Pseudomonadota bacterium]